jgi:exopolysaccharide biosynthesis protein
VLSAAPATDEATRLLALTPGTEMKLRWTVGWANVFDIVSGGPILLRDGQVATSCDRSCAIHPRTGVGVTASGEIMLVVIDGRHPRWSRGVSLVRFAHIMRDLGAVAALNLDGGGSSVMVVEGEVVNRPSDGRERALSNAIVVLPGTDPGEQ